MGGGDPVTALVIAAALGAWAACGILGILVILGAGKLARGRGDDIEAIADATREEPQPDFAAWERQFRTWMP